MTDAIGFRDTFLLNGKVPGVGDVLTQRLFAQTLEQLARAGLDDFYRGDVGREIAIDLERIGSPVTRDDLSRQRARIDEPLEVRLNVGTIYNTPPPTQGLASLLILGLFDRLHVASAESFAHIHGIVEATKRAFRVRDRVVADPAKSGTDVTGFVAARYLDRDVRKIDVRRAAPWPARSADGDTIWMGAADASGLVVSYIQSIYWEFGSGCVLPRTGVLMQNRGASFSLEERALNALAPRRLPFHTLNPALAVLDDGRVMAYGTMGGDGQPQTQAALFTRHVVFQQSLYQALDAPRWLLGRTWGSAQTNLRLEARFDSGIEELLHAAGHDVFVLAEPYSDTMGHAGAVVRHAGGLMEGGHDPRADGGAAGM
jgi:gamma-glutamyltranspeptidase/glutathione hydrolase